MQTPRRDIGLGSSYLIRVVGELHAGWLDYYDEISVVVSLHPGFPCVSTICAHNVDQALLMGILNTLYEYQFPILSLECLSSSETTRSPTPPVEGVT